MTAAERLHPAVQHHLVNSLGWRTLRAHQERAIEPILSGANVLVQAPTAGGKTEAAVLPTMSRMLEERWTQLSVLYLCPIKALLNDLEIRVSRMLGFVGRRVGVWHGDVSAAARRALVRESPDLLLTTPESLEVMLVSRAVDHEGLFRRLRVVIVDEVHAFAGDDRGWHLLSLIGRIEQLTEQAPIQRITLSATLANPVELLDWLSAGRDVPQQVVLADQVRAAEADVQVDAVGSLPNAGLVISKLHRGEKRLVFTDSRSRAEELAHVLRANKVETYVSHSSVGIDERRRAEAAFAAGRDCVIVATSTLELGIDVGDLDRVVQIDAPASVASFLQRLGRSGRRPGIRRNCLLLTTDDESLLRALAIVRLWNVGWVEPVVPPPAPWHVVAQQILAAVLQEGDRGIDAAHLFKRLSSFLTSARLAPADFAELLEHLLKREMLTRDGDVIGIGREGERAYGARHFLEIFSVFQSPPLVSVFHGLDEIGEVHESTFQRKTDEPLCITLAGRAWRVRHLDWVKRRAYAEPSEESGRSRWLGEGPAMSYELAQAIARVLCDGAPDGFLSVRSRESLNRLRADFEWLLPNATTALFDSSGVGLRWWTFAGDRYNSALGAAARSGHHVAGVDALGITISGVRTAAEAQILCESLSQSVVNTSQTIEPYGFAERTKFIELLPSRLRMSLVGARFGVGDAAERIAGMPIELRIQT